MRARFIGPVQSLGYVPGQVYVLDVRTNLIGDRPRILRPQPCPYGSWQAFWRNWELVSDAVTTTQTPEG